MMVGAVVAQNQVSVGSDLNKFFSIQSQIDESNENIEGSPYLSKEWATGVIEFGNNSRLEKVSIRLNAYNNTVEANIKDITYQVSIKDLNSFAYIDPVTKERWVFKRATLDRYNNTVLRIILDDKVTFGAYYNVRLIKGTKQESGYEAISHAKDKYSLNTTYYLLLDGNRTIKLPRNTKSFLKKLPTHRDEVEDYLNKNSLDIRNDEDLTRAITFYNSIY